MNERDRRISRPWRIAFVVYAIMLTIGTHWPRLELPEESPVRDKTVHLLAFGGFTLLLWRTRWVRSLALAAMLAMGWAAIDEFTQGIPGLNRHVTMFDLVANALGVLVMAAWIWTFSQVGVRGGFNRRRLQQSIDVVDEMFTHWQPWIVLGLAIAGVGCVWLVMRLVLSADADSLQQALVMAAIVAGALVTLNLQQRWQKGLAAQRSATEIAPSRRLYWRMARKPLLIATLCVIAGFVVLALLPLLYAWLLNKPLGGWTMRITRAVGTLPPEFTNTVDLAIFALLIAAVVRVYRTRLARYYDQSLLCFSCGHDLRGTPLNEQGMGRCGECGAEFSRMTGAMPRV